MENNSENQIIKIEDTIFNTLFCDNNIRIYGTVENPLIIANDLSNILKIVDIKSTIRDYENDEKIKVQISLLDKNGLNRLINMNCLTEKGVYRLIFNSHSEVAKSFRNFVFELLHNLRIGKIKLITDENTKLKNDIKAMEDLKIDGVVYVIKNNITNQFYIGSTIQSINKRWNEHKKCKGYSKFTANIKKYGWFNFAISIHSTHKIVNERELRKIERDVRNEFKKNEDTRKLLLNQRN